MNVERRTHLFILSILFMLIELPSKLMKTMDERLAFQFLCQCGLNAAYSLHHGTTEYEKCIRSMKA